MVIVDVPVLVHTADDGMKVRYAALGFLVQPYGRLAVCDMFVRDEMTLPSLSRISWLSKASAKSFHSCCQSSEVKFSVCSIARLISMRMTLFFMFGWFIVANFISVQIPVASMPCGMKLSQMRVILSGCFLFLDSPDT